MSAWERGQERGDIFRRWRRGGELLSEDEEGLAELLGDVIELVVEFLDLTLAFRELGAEFFDLGGELFAGRFAFFLIGRAHGVCWCSRTA